MTISLSEDRLIKCFVERGEIIAAVLWVWDFRDHYYRPENMWGCG